MIINAQRESGKQLTTFQCFYTLEAVPEPQERRLLAEVHHANHFWTRLKGLLGQKTLDPDVGLLIEPCHSVHTLGMAFPIAVLFLSEENVIVHISSEMKPQRLSPIVKGAKKVLELHPETLKAVPLQVGQKLVFHRC